MIDTPLLTGVQVFDCQACRGRGHLRGQRQHCPNCQGRRVIIIQYGRVLTLTSDPAPLPERRDGETRLKPTTMRQRAADSRCVICASPDLWTRDRCRPCAAENSEATGRARRNRTQT